jgi:hypothetical protein
LSKNQALLGSLTNIKKKDVFFNTRDEARSFVKENPFFKVKKYEGAENKKWGAILDESSLLNSQLAKVPESLEILEKVLTDFNEEELSKFQRLIDIETDSLDKLSAIEKSLKGGLYTDPAMVNDDFTQFVSEQ